MKRLVAVLLLIVLVMTLLVGCGRGRNLYDTADLTKYVEMCEYDGIVIDTSSKEYLKLYAYYLGDDINVSGATTENIKKAITFDSSAETVVELGDIVDIDYTGYMNEEAFEGGSAAGALLTIGSGTFIDNFEEQLVGSKPGQTVDVNVTFPNEYPNNPELAGARAKFVVKINSVAKEPEQIYELFQFDSKEEYVKLVEKRSQRSYLFNYILENSKVNDYPEDDVEIFYEALTELYKESYGFDLSTTDKDTVLKNFVYPAMREYMLMYYILDQEELEILDTTVDSQQASNPVIAECYAVYDTSMNYLMDKAKIK